jgi:hypothetical protein
MPSEWLSGVEKLLVISVNLCSEFILSTEVASELCFNYCHCIADDV